VLGYLDASEVSGSSDYLTEQALLAATFLVLGLFGGWVHYQRDRRSFWYFGSLMFTMTLVLIYYLNFKLGASQDPGSQAPHEVRDRDYFFLWSFSAWGVWAALGLLFVWESIAALIGSETVKVGRESVSMPKKTSLRMSSPVLLLAAVPLFANWKYASRAGHHDTRDFAADILNSVEPYGVLVTVGDNDTFPLWYAQEVEGIRKDVVVANTSLLNTDWYTRQLIRRPVYEYDAARYRERLSGWSDQFLAGVEVLTYPGTTLAVTLVSVLGWIVDLFTRQGDTAAQDALLGVVQRLHGAVARDHKIILAPRIIETKIILESRASAPRHGHAQRLGSERLRPPADCPTLAPSPIQGAATETESSALWRRKEFRSIPPE
jgi:hypothetical protein